MRMSWCLDHGSLALVLYPLFTFQSLSLPCTEVPVTCMDIWLVFCLTE